jgi:hypothetical protein
MRFSVNIAHILSYLSHAYNPFLVVISGNIPQNRQNQYDFQQNAYLITIRLLALSLSGFRFAPTQPPFAAKVV